MPVVIISSEDQFKTIIKDEKKPLTFVDFTATWCGPCKIIKPFFHELAVKLADKANFCEIDVDENETLAMQMGVNAMPTFQVLFKGEKKDQLIGASKDKLEAMLETALKLIEEVASEDKKADENKPEVTKPEVKKPEVTKPEVTKPEEKKPEEKTEEKK